MKSQSVTRDWASGASGGALPKMMLPFKSFLGGYPGKGDQWFSWISLEDEIAAIEFLLKNEQLSGPFNLTSPSPVTARQFAKTLRTLDVQIPSGLTALAVHGERITGHGLHDEPVQHRSEQLIVIEKRQQVFIFAGFLGEQSVHRSLH